MRLARYVVAAPLFAIGALLALYGLVGLLYSGEGKGGSATYVTLAGHRRDAHLVGVLSLVIALAISATGVAIMRWRPFHH